MSHEERNTVATLIASILVNIYVVMKLRRMFEDGRLAGEDAVQTWAQAMLWVIPVGIGVVIVSTIIFNILHAIATGDTKPSFIVDERDHVIQSFGMKVSMVATGVGFIGMMVALATGAQILTALIGMWFAFAAGDVLGKIAQLVRYRRGY